MRVTDKVIYQNSTSRMQASKSRWARAQEIAQTGVRVSKPSDDPYAAARATRESATIKTATATGKLADAASLRAQGADSALSSANDLIARARELATQAANGTISADDRASIAKEVQGIRAQMIQVGNTKIGDSYVFGGMRDGSAPFDATTGAYTGATDVRRLQVAPNTFISDGVSGDQIFGSAGGTDILQLLSDLDTALTSNNISGVQATLGSLQDATNQISRGRASLGALMNQFDTVKSAADRTVETATAARTSLVDADVFQAYNDFASAQRALEAAVQVASQLPSAGLVTS